MRTRAIPVAAAIAAASALAVGIGQAGAASKATKISCVVKLQEHNDPGKPANPLVGQDFGTITCTSPLGNGLQHDNFTMTPTSMKPLAGTGVVHFKDFFDAGTIAGTWTLKWSGSSTSDIKFTITKVSFSKGTGVFKGIAGTGKGSGQLADSTHGNFKWTADITRF
jgi:hypothetical protein